MNEKRSVLVISVCLILLPMALILSLAFNSAAAFSPSNSFIQKFTNAGVVLDLPSGELIPHHKIRIIAYSALGSSNTGAADAIAVHIWVPEYNSYVPVTFVSDNQIFLEKNAEIWAGYPALDQNHILVDDEDLEVTFKYDVLKLELKESVEITITEPAPEIVQELSFTLPTLTVEFRGFDNAWREKSEEVTLPSGWTLSSGLTVKKPAWVSATIPDWNIHQHITVGNLNKYACQIWVPPTG